MWRRAPRFLVVGPAIAVLGACDPNVVIGEKWHLNEGGFGGQTGSAGTSPLSGAGGSAGNAGSSTEVNAGASGSDEGGASDTSMGGAPPTWCATAPWLNTPVLFTGESGSDIPAGNYIITYEYGAQLHDPSMGYEVTAHYYGKNGLQAGHHIYTGDTVETGATTVWLEDTGLVTGSSVAVVENGNRGHTWAFQHGGGELHITLYDDDYHDNLGPGSHLCISAAKP